jgi:hypothetical protein
MRAGHFSLKLPGLSVPTIIATRLLRILVWSNVLSINQATKFTRVLPGGKQRD